MNDTQTPAVFDVEYRGRRTDERWTPLGHGPLTHDAAHRLRRGSQANEGHDHEFRVALVADSAADLAQRAADAHYAIASNDDRDICSGDSPVYRASLRLLGHLLRVAYPGCDVELVYGLLVDSGESAYTCVMSAADDPESAEEYREPTITREMGA